MLARSRSQSLTITIAEKPISACLTRHLPNKHQTPWRDYRPNLTLPADAYAFACDEDHRTWKARRGTLNVAHFSPIEDVKKIMVTIWFLIIAVGLVLVGVIELLDC
jgi:hypothetical protein